MRLTTKEITITALFTVLMIISGKLVIPLSIVPITMQTTVSLLSGLILGRRGALRVHMLYLFMGLIGLPVFASGGGIAYVLQPSFGYLPGMAAGSWLVGLLADQADLRQQQLRNWQAILANLLGLFVIYAFGVGYLYFLHHFYTDGSITFIRAIQVGMLPFIAIDGVFAVAVAFAAPALRRSTYLWREQNKRSADPVRD